MAKRNILISTKTINFGLWVHYLGMNGKTLMLKDYNSQPEIGKIMYTKIDPIQKR